MTYAIKEDDHVTRHCSSLYMYDDKSPRPSAFQLRQGKDDFLSVNWIEYFGMSNFHDNMLMVQKEVVKHRTIRNGKYAIFNVGNVKKTIKEAVGISLEINRHDDYPSHAGIHGYSAADNLMVAHKLADMVGEEDMHDLLVRSA